MCTQPTEIKTMTTETKQTTTVTRPIVTTKRSQWDFGPRCPRCGGPTDPCADYETVCHACACIEIEMKERGL